MPLQGTVCLTPRGPDGQKENDVTGRGEKITTKKKEIDQRQAHTVKGPNSEKKSRNSNKKGKRRACQEALNQTR